MDLPTPEKVTKSKEELEKEEYIKDLHTLARAQNYISKVFGEESGVDYMITECENYARSGKLSKHCLEYAEKELPQLTEEEIAAALPQTWDGKPIFSHKDVK